MVCCRRGGGRAPFVPLPPIALSCHYGSIYPSVQNLLLAARSVGLGGALITLPLWSTTAARRTLKLPLMVEPCCIVTLDGRLSDRGPRLANPLALSSISTAMAGSPGVTTS